MAHVTKRIDRDDRVGQEAAAERVGDDAADDRGDAEHRDARAEEAGQGRLAERHAVRGRTRE